MSQTFSITKIDRLRFRIASNLQNLNFISKFLCGKFTNKIQIFYTKKLLLKQAKLNSLIFCVWNFTKQKFQNYKKIMNWILTYKFCHFWIQDFKNLTKFDEKIRILDFLLNLIFAWKFDFWHFWDFWPFREPRNRQNRQKSSKFEQKSSKSSKIRNLPKTKSRILTKIVKSRSNFCPNRRKSSKMPKIDRKSTKSTKIRKLPKSEKSNFDENRRKCQKSVEKPDQNP